jgi:hypothetical protein
LLESNVSSHWRRQLASWLTASLLLALMLASRPAWADDDPPGRVGRVTESQGQSWVYDGEAGEWVELLRNRPLTAGDRIAVDANGRLELRIGSTAVRLAGGSELEVRRLDDDRIDLFLINGSAALRVRSPEVAREVELATNEGRFTSRRAGHYRIDRRDDTTYATTWNGELQFEGSDSTLTIASGRTAELWREGANNATHYSWSEPQQDEFADWTARASREDERVAAVPYVSPEMTGWEDLERNGRWDTHPEYGALWMPTTVVAGWAPYRYGHWAWIRPWGWTWVDDAPWGFAPFHYGRWVTVGGRWCWAPGRYVARPVYAPALVAWVGGSHASLHLGGPPVVGWVPLAPREPYYPSYARGGGYWKAVNSAQLNLFPPSTPRRAPSGAIMYANQGVPGAVSAVPSTALVPRRPMAPVIAQVDPSIRSNLSTQPWRPHVPPPGVARVIAVPGQATAPPNSAPPPGQPSVLPRRPPSPALMAQPPAAAAIPQAPNLRERIPRPVMPIAPPQAVNPTVVPQAMPPQAATPQVRTPTAPQVRIPAAPQVQVPPPAPPAQVAPPPAQRRFEPGEPGGMRREPPGRSVQSNVSPAPAVRTTRAPAQATEVRPLPPQGEFRPPAPRQEMRVAPPPPQPQMPAQPQAQQREREHDAPHAARPEQRNDNNARARVPEQRGQRDRNQMQ